MERYRARRGTRFLAAIGRPVGVAAHALDERRVAYPQAEDEAARVGGVEGPPAAPAAPAVTASRPYMFAIPVPTMGRELAPRYSCGAVSASRP